MSEDFDWVCEECCRSRPLGGVAWEMGILDYHKTCEQCGKEDQKVISLHSLLFKEPKGD